MTTDRASDRAAFNRIADALRPVCDRGERLGFGLGLGGGHAEIYLSIDGRPYHVRVNPAPEPPEC